MSDIRKLTAQYFQLVDPSTLALPTGEILVQHAVQTALYERMFNNAAMFPLPPANYRTRVLKLILSRIEAAISDPEEDEILDDLISTWSSLVSQPKPSAIQQAQELALIKYTAPAQIPGTPSLHGTDDRTVITRESRGLILSSGTTGFRTWEAALHLASFLATVPGEALVRGKRVIELGAGTGFVSLFCARYLGVRSIVATDREVALVDNMRECVLHNQDDNRIPFYASVWEWGTPLELPIDYPSALSGTEREKSLTEKGNKGDKFDVALGADLIYDADLVPLLLSTVRDLFDNYGVEQFIISATLRNEDTFRTFMAGCETNAFSITTLPFESAPSEAQTGFFHSTDIPIRTYRITRKPTDPKQNTELDRIPFNNLRS